MQVQIIGQNLNHTQNPSCKGVWVTLSNSCSVEVEENVAGAEKECQ